MSTATQRPHHNEGPFNASNSVSAGVAGDSILWEHPTVFLYRDYQDMVYGLDAARLVGPMLFMLISPLTFEDMAYDSKHTY